MAEEPGQTGQGTGGGGGQGTGGSQQGQGQQGSSAGNRTFTQAELDAIIADRLGREREKYKDYDSLKATKTELDKIKQSQMTETERLQKMAGDNERRAIEAESRIAQVEIKADFTEKALAAGVTDIKLAYLAAQAEGLLGAYNPDKGVGKHSFEELKKRYPNLFAARASGSVDGGVGGGRMAGGGMNDFIRRAAGRT